MLRITSDYNVAATKGLSFLSWDLLKGVLVALAIHATLFFGIKVQSPTYHETFVILAPVAVEIDLGNTSRTYGPSLAEPSVEPYTPLDFLSVPPPTFVVDPMTLPPLPIEEPDFSEIEYTFFRSLPDFEEEKTCLQ